MADTEPLDAESRRLIAISRLLAEKAALLNKAARDDADKRRLKEIEAELKALGPPEKYP